MTIERLSIELGQRCSKACWFCYSASHANGETRWTAAEIVALVRDCAAHGLRAVSFGGGEPLESALLWPALAGLRGVVFRSLTSNGLLLDEPEVLERLIAAAPDKVHLSIHFPGRAPEVARVIRQVHALADRGLRSGVNLLIHASQLDAAARAARALHAAGIDNRRIVYLPMRGRDTPSPAAIAAVAGRAFASVSCLRGCEASPRFCALGWDRSVRWCSYTSAHASLRAPSHAALQAALRGLGLRDCGVPDDARPRVDVPALRLAQQR